MPLTTRRREHISDGMLLLIAIIWGFCFPFVKQCLNTGMSSAQLVLYKFIVSSLIMLAVFFPHLKKLTRAELRVGLLAGILLFAANHVSTLGQGMTTPANSAIINSAYIILIPFIERLFGRPRPGWKVVLCAAICFAGIALINYDPAKSLRFSPGDLVVLLGAVFFALHIAFLGNAVTEMTPQKLTTLQMLVCTALCAVTCLVTDGSLMRVSVRPVIWPLLYIGALGTAFGYGVQIFAQRYSKPSKAGILMSLEGMFGAVFSVILGMSVLTAGLGIGTVLGVASVVLLELTGAQTTDNNDKEDATDEAASGTGR